MKTSIFRWAKLSLFCLALLVALGGTASAVTYTVTTVTDHPITTVTSANGQIVSGAGAGQVTLRSAVIAANQSGVGPHTINVPAGTYNLSQTNPNTPGTTATAGFNDLQIGSHLSTITITGTGAAPQIVQTIAGNDVITTGFKADGSPAIVGLTLNNLDISGGSFTGIFTGADDATNRSNTTITNCNIHNNTNGDATSGQGGAIYNQTGSLSISGTTFANNSATNAGVGQGGAIFYNLPNAAGAQGVIGSLSVTNCTFNSNTSAIGATFPAGGAMFIAVSSDDTKGGAINITGCTFNGNTATGGGNGGAIAVLNGLGRTLNITTNNFISNQVTNAAGGGGAISMSSGTANINFNRFTGNTATTLANGQAIFHGNPDAVNANDNWWLSNTGPAVNSVAGAGVTLANFLQLKLSSSPASVITGGTSTLTATFLSDSANNAISAGNLTQLVGRAVTFGSDALGSTSGAQPSIQAAGTATATFTGGALAGVSSASAVVEGVTANANVTIRPTVTLNVTNVPITATTLTINGFGFSPTPGNNTVTFNNGAVGSVTSASATSLTVTSVSGLTAGALNAVVTTNGLNSGAAVQVATVVAPDVSVAIGTTPVLENSSSGLVYTFARTGDMTAPLAINFTKGGSATFTSDFSASSSGTVNYAAGTLTIPAGQSSATVTLVPVDDRQVEGDETVVLTVAAGSGYGIAGSPATGTITDNDTATIALSGGAPSITEGGSIGVLTLLVINATGTGPVMLDRTVKVTIQNPATGTATGGGVDYTHVNSTVTYNPGAVNNQAGVTSIISVDDRLVEGTETIDFILGNLVDGTNGQVTLTGTLTRTLQILDNDTATLGFTAGTSTALESAGTQNVGVTLTVSATGTGTIGLVSNLTANLTTTGGTATGGGTDYTLPTSPAVTFLAGTYATGTAAQNAVVGITDDSIPEGDETAVFGLSILQNIGTQVSLGGTTAHTLTITDNDVPDYNVTTTGNAIVVTDAAGNSDTLAVSEPVAGSIKFAAAGRTFSVDNAVQITGDSGNLTLTGVTSITVNAAGGNDVINVAAFSGTTFPSLTINGGTGNDTVNMNGDITFAANASLDLNLQNDSATPGTDDVIFGGGANLLTSGTGAITVKVSRYLGLTSGSSLETVNGGITLESNQQAIASTGSFSGVEVLNAIVRSTGTGLVSLTGRGGTAAGGRWAFSSGRVHW